MFSLSRRLTALVFLVGVLKVLIFVLAKQSSDFNNFTQMAQYDFTSLTHGTLAFNGAYSGMGIFLALFYGLWLALPINHANDLLLGLALKIPIIAFDFLAGVLIYWVTKAATKSSSYGRKGFLIWYLNPFNLILIFVWGSVDTIPAVFLLLAILLGYKHKWSAAGLSLAVASILRLFPILLFPALLIFVLRQGRRAATSFAAAFLAPLVGACVLLIMMFGSLSAVVNVFANLALQEPYLLFFGYPLLPDVPLAYNLCLGLLLFALQLYIMKSFWKTPSSLLSPSLAFLFILFAATSQMIYHFNWVTPLLTADYVISRQRPRLFILLFVFAFLSYLSGLGLPSFTPGYLLGFPAYGRVMQAAAEFLMALSPALYISRLLYPGIFVGLLLCFLIGLNLRSMRISPIRMFEEVRETLG
jgi:hypothetical protein